MNTKEALIKYGYEYRESKFKGKKEIYKDGSFIASMTALQASMYLKERHGWNYNE